MGEDETKIEGRLRGEQFEPEQPDNMLLRLVYMLLIAVMISLAQTVLGVATIIQFVDHAGEQQATQRAPGRVWNGPGDMGCEGGKIPNRRKQCETVALDRTGLI